MTLGDGVFPNNNVDHGSHDRSLHVSIVILNWNGWQRTILALESLRKSLHAPSSLIVLDNGSGDDSVPRLIEWFQKVSPDFAVLTPPRSLEPGCVCLAESNSCSLLRSNTNQGFAGGSNSAIRYALERYTPDFVFLLNNDATVEANCIGVLIASSESAGAAIAGATVRNPEGTASHFTGANPIKELFFAAKPVPLATLPDIWETQRIEGSGVLIASSFLHQRVGEDGWVFDPQLFLYCEDADFCLRATRLGKKIIMVKNALIFHGLAQSFGGAGNVLQYYYITRNRIYLAKRWLNLPMRILFHLYYAPSRLLRSAQHYAAGNARVGSAILEAVGDGYAGRYGKWKKHIG